MKKSVAALALLTALVGTSAPALARADWSSQRLVLSMSLGDGVMLAPSTNERLVNSTSGSPLALELMAGFHLNHWVTLDAGFVFAYDVFDPYHGRANSYYAGFRPGVHLYGGRGGPGFRPYFRGALPLTFDNATGTVGVGLLLGVGVEYKFRVVGVFGEMSVSPYFNNDNLVPIEFRLGIAFHI